MQIGCKKQETDEKDVGVKSKLKKSTEGKLLLSQMKQMSNTTRRKMSHNDRKTNLSCKTAKKSW